MRVVIIAPGRYHRAATVQEANRAAADGHDVLAIVGSRDAAQDSAFAEDVQVRFNETRRLQTRGSLAARRWLSETPMRLLRRCQRGPLHRPVGKARSVYRDRVAEPLERRLAPADQRLRLAVYTRYVADQVRDWDPDLVVLLSVDAIALADEFLPWLEERRTSVAYVYA